MARTLETAYTTKARVLAIEEFGSYFVKATVEDWEDEGLVVERSCTYSLHGFRLLNGAEAAPKVFQGKKMDDKEDVIFLYYLKSVLSYITLCFIPAKRSNHIDSVLQCKPSTPDTQRPTSRHDDVEKHLQGHLGELILRTSSHGYQCRKSDCRAQFTLSGFCMFHEEKHHEAESSYYKSSGETADPKHTLSDTANSIHSSTALTQQTWRTGSSDSSQTLFARPIPWTQTLSLS